MTEDTLQKFETIMRHLVGTGNDALTGVDVSSQFNPSDVTGSGIGKNLNAAFLIVLCGTEHPQYAAAVRYLGVHRSDDRLNDISSFYKNGLQRIHEEVSTRLVNDSVFSQHIDNLYEYLEDSETRVSRIEVIEKIRNVFFPEGADIFDDKEERISRLREKRKITVSRLNQDPITNPAREILFTSNILMTIPPAAQNIMELPLSEQLNKRIAEVAQEEQLYWYDHPIQIGVEPDKNEALYGLRGLEEALRYEVDHGSLPQDARLDCVLSVSTTHNGLQGLTMDYLQEEFARYKGITRLNIYLFNESDTRKMIHEILIPAAERYVRHCRADLLNDIIGVDGEYGRHYSFLKAISAFWQVFIDPVIRGTFKIDLDQVFPQEELVTQSGTSAFRHFDTPLWGAEGIDSSGSEIELGMIAGALVNEKDISESLFCPDVCFPPEEIRGDEVIFYSSLPQALSTEAEMMTRYTSGTCDGTTGCIQRIHVTGGTCGILVDSLRRYRPFTPTFIGRAEDQAYLLSVLFADPVINLRYVHKDGLVMRHDKESFAQEAIESAHMGKLVGDYARILWFSYYVRALPWSYERIKELIDPFTGCFVTQIPFTIVYLRLAFKVASLFSPEDELKNDQAYELLTLGVNRLSKIVTKLTSGPNPLKEQYNREKEGWNLFYDILDLVEKNLKENDPFAHALRIRARNLVNDCKLKC